MIATELARRPLDEPALHATLLERRRRWEELLVPLVAARLGARPGASLAVLLDEAVAAVAEP